MGAIIVVFCVAAISWLVVDLVWDYRSNRDFERLRVKMEDLNRRFPAPWAR